MDGSAHQAQIADHFNNCKEPWMTSISNSPRFWW